MSFEQIISLSQSGFAAIFLAIGVFFVIAGSIGVLRLPDFYTRIHAAGMTDTLGAELILLGLIIQSGFSQTSLKLLIIGFILFLTSPGATHAIVSAAYGAGLKPILGKYSAPMPGLTQESRNNNKTNPAKKTNRAKSKNNNKGGEK